MAVLTEKNDNDEDNASCGSVDSQEVYYHFETGKIYSGREARSILAAEGHATDRAPSLSDAPSSPPPDDQDSEADYLQSVSSFSGPTQSSIDKALYCPNSPATAGAQLAYHKKNSGQHPASSYDGIMDSAPPPSDDEDEDVLRAKAMALAAQNGRKLTPAQLQLIAQPDVQQQKLIEEAKRIQTAKESALRQAQKEQLLRGVTEVIAPEKLQRMGADIKEFIKAEKEKPPLQWGADLGKFIESQSMKRSTKNEVEQDVGDCIAVAESAEVEDERGEGSGHLEDSAAAKPAATAAADDSKNNAKTKKVMEGFGTDPLAPRFSPRDSSAATFDPASANPSVKWPTLPLFNEGITSMLSSATGGGAGKGGGDVASLDLRESVTISGVLWKRRSGFGKHSTIKAWERRRVELRGSKLIYYSTQEEKEEDGKDTSLSAAEEKTASGTASVGSNSRGGEPPSAKETVLPNVNAADSTPAPPSSETSPSQRPRRGLSFFGQAAQAAEQRLESARLEISRIAATATGLESLGPHAADAPRGVLDVLRERASVGVSAGHSDAPTPFCLSIKVKGETRWKFGFDGHGALMEWLARLTDVIVGASVDAAGGKTDEGGGSSRNDCGSWEMENYCIQRMEECTDENKHVNLAVSPKNAVSTAGMPQNSLVLPAAVSEQWMLSGMNLWIAWAAANVAFIIARSSSTTVDQYWKIVVFTNFGFYQLCRGWSDNSGSSTLSETNMIHQADSLATLKTNTKCERKSSDYKPIAGSTTIQVTKVEDPRINKNGDTMPSWISVSSGDIINVRGPGYLTNRKKIPSPGELYECMAVDCFVSNERIPEIAPRVRLPPTAPVNLTDGKENWNSPEVFIVSIAIPTEAPRFGQSTDDGIGLTVIGYFKMKDETRNILRRITADPSATNMPELESDAEKCKVNGVRLWERYCGEALDDPIFQARFKLVPLANLEELGCPSYIAKYSGKPVLIKRNQVTGFFNDYPSLNVMEFDISLHPFPYLFKQAMSYIKDYLDKSVASFGFVIEGRSEDELPEVVIGAMTVCYPDLKTAAKGEEFFAGTCTKSTS